MMKRRNMGLYRLLVFTILFALGHYSFALTADYEYDDQYRLTNPTIPCWLYTEYFNEQKSLKETWNRFNYSNFP